MSLPSVLIASPIRDRAWILPDFLKRLENLDYPASKLSYFFLVNDCQDNSLEHVLNFRDRNMGRYESIQVLYRNYGVEPDRRDASRKGRYAHLARLRNLILDAALYARRDYLFSVDSDILVYPWVLKNLVSWNAPVVSSLIHNDRNHTWPDKDRYFNVLQENLTGSFTHMRKRDLMGFSSIPLVPVDATGAVVLMDRDVYANTRYGDHPQGEDLAWSLSVKRLGLQLYCDIGTVSCHVMDPKDLKLVREGRLYW